MLKTRKKENTLPQKTTEVLIVEEVKVSFRFCLLSFFKVSKAQQKIQNIQLRLHAFAPCDGLPLVASFVSDHRVRAGTAGLNPQLHPHVTYLLLRSGSPRERASL